MEFIFKLQILLQIASKPRKLILHFTTHFSSKASKTLLTNLNSLNIVKNILPQHSHSLYIFFRKHFSGWFQEKYLHKH